MLRAKLPALVELNAPAETPLHSVLLLLWVDELELLWLPDEALVTFVLLVYVLDTPAPIS